MSNLDAIRAIQASQAEAKSAANAANAALQASQAEGIYTMLAEAQAEMQNPPLNGSAQAGQRRYRYAMLADVLESVRGPLNRRGLFLSQHIDGDMLHTYVAGGSERLLLDCRRIDLSGTSQQQGSAETYAKRYALCSVFGIVGVEDDDGEAASEKPQSRNVSRQEAPRQANPRNTAVERLNAAIAAYCAAHDKDDWSVKAEVKGRADFEDTAEFYNRVAEEYETE